MIALPQKTPEDSPIPHIKRMQRTINILIDAMRAREIQQSPGTRVERTSGGVFIHPRTGGVIVQGTDDFWY